MPQYGTRFASDADLPMQITNSSAERTKGAGNCVDLDLLDLQWRRFAFLM